MKFHIFNAPRILSLTASCIVLSTASLAGADYVSKPIPPTEPIAPPISPEPLTTHLSGTFSDVSIKPNAAGTKVKVSALVALRNSGNETATRVTAKVYLSPDPTLSAGAKPIVVLHLAAFENGDGKLKPSGKISIPLKYNLPTLLAPGLSGQYVIVVLSSAQGVAANPIVYGPLPKVL